MSFQTLFVIAFVILKLKFLSKLITFIKVFLEVEIFSNPLKNFSYSF